MRSACGRATSRRDRPCRGRPGRRRARRTSAWCRRRRDVDAAPREDQPVVFHVLADLEDARVLQQRLQRCERLPLRNLVRRRAWPPARTGRCRPRAAVAVAERHVAGLVVGDAPARSRTDAACIGSRLVVSVSTATTPASLRARDPGVEPRRACATVSYLLRSILLARAAARCAAASCGGRVRASPLARGCPRPRAPRSGVGAVAAAERSLRRVAADGWRRPRRRARRQLRIRLDLARVDARPSRRRAASAW